MMEKKTERRGLGRGLSALMADVAVEIDPQTTDRLRRPDLLVPVERLVPNPNQPRRDFQPEALQELASSIRSRGVIQPLIVRDMGDGRYEIVAGERRWRAAQLAQVHELPVIIREFTDSEVIEVAIIENIQRADLNAIEEALAFRQLMDRFGHSQEKLAEALSKSRSHIANLLRLLNLPEDVQTFVREGKLTAGHARALITAPNASELARQVLAKNLSVREVEALARDPSKKGTGKASGPRAKSDKDADTRALENDLSANLNMRVTIDHAGVGDGGVLSIRYRTLDDLDLLCRALSLIPRDGTI
ncbi:ParB/RepB/Spo0J family partition protein [Rhodobacteraceae bacterium HSP-20]|uniref:ParB/RepB/Spo0J family partition protein n=1 Tax=Paragemmobacter amnigenus TaxID=2852097 RepID=A0ABS6J349_9RHOB|nr:ParB/RepB/Spo0J family partition protein [Rhodobacter amnigenus]MBU9697862.1 ParB/RepB/Spo0J family partition protein [Rhodobacter amnigenus]MBV4389089.1 ParB/RepB/Spo0J family partition protein [Rhodobacter amnigenus]